MRNRLAVFLFALLAVAMLISACSSGSSNTTPAPTSALDGATLVQERCSVCHPLSRVEASSYTAAQWKTIVNTMIARGAQLNSAEATAVENYLAANFGK
jgi:hypothetical protein